MIIRIIDLSLRGPKRVHFERQVALRLFMLLYRVSLLLRFRRCTGEVVEAERKQKLRELCSPFVNLFLCIDHYLIQLYQLEGFFRLIEYLGITGNLKLLEGVGKSSLLLSFTSDAFEDLSPTIVSELTNILRDSADSALELNLAGVDFKVKHVTLGGKKLKLAIWDTAGQERFRTLTSSYYRGAQGIIMVYDVTRRDTFTNLSDIWAKEIDLYSTNQECIKMLVGNKVDKESERVVSKKEGIEFAREYGCLFIECSAKTRVNVEQCFEELVLKILDTPSLLAEGSAGVRKNIFRQKPPESDASTSGCC
ncbi:hypothetical protein MTR67_019985 [Solanum verrucosum]|uniref:Ras-related protein RABC1 n=1 Tax=Solanum verrucosum TaxID=315347 RepID=A0AAF0QQ81_SOLVR|nr:hypothetical protein MTR67_019985 [Solanum verrucosum]